MKFKKGEKVKIVSKEHCPKEYRYGPMDDIGNIRVIDRIEGDGSGKDDDNLIVIMGNYYGEKDLKKIKDVDEKFDDIISNIEKTEKLC